MLVGEERRVEGGIGERGRTVSVFGTTGGSGFAEDDGCGGLGGEEEGKEGGGELHVGGSVV